jgi:hypothetical protein
MLTLLRNIEVNLTTKSSGLKRAASKEMGRKSGAAEPPFL